MKSSTKGVLIGGGVVALLITILIIRKGRKITASRASKMSDKELKKQLLLTLKKQALCGKIAQHKDNASDKKLNKKVKKVSKCMKTHAESMLNLSAEMKKRLCDKDPNQEGC